MNFALKEGLTRDSSLGPILDGKRWGNVAARLLALAARSAQLAVHGQRETGGGGTRAARTHERERERVGGGGGLSHRGSRARLRAARLRGETAPRLRGGQDVVAQLDGRAEARLLGEMKRC